ncbi:FAD-binding oxidoreductase [Rhodohalobacter sulfatireducens]|uniref:FAD-binding oxidoreductase n=1 Tax=Rhodohalobacter sulfatireducens TaxID=2911366 RepID=A0ABS9KC91_9BACT|nr:FAD-binding oxidoreductase [Rhodohalobacter sulfatireducens]MCG2588428.1 FAD-binding oxidoreductase [Rhodohalobacter sulfatireducens]
MSYTVAIKSIEKVTHDVKKFTFEKPEGYSFTPGQATEASINKEGWEDEKRPFTFTSLNEDPDLEFIIKIYEDHDGVTNQIGKLEVGDEFIIDDPWGTIQYKGPGVYLAGGAGVTPFIAIFRDLHKKGELEGNTLIFSNKTAKDVILQEEFEEMLGDNFVSVLTDKDAEGHMFLDGFIDKDFLAEQIDNYDQPFYVCGPMKFNENMMKYLKELGAEPDSLVFEE